MMQLKTVPMQKKVFTRFEKNLPKDANADDVKFVNELRKRINRNDPVIVDFVTAIISDTPQSDVKYETVTNVKSKSVGLLPFAIIMGGTISAVGISPIENTLQFFVIDIVAILLCMILKK